MSNNEIISPEFFKIISNPSFSFILYGFGKLGEDLYNKLSKSHNIISIIDKNKIGTQIDTLTIKSIDSLDDYVSLENIIILNTVLNPLESSKIKKNIMKKNIKWIILQLNDYLEEELLLLRNKLLSLSNPKMYLNEIGWVQSIKMGLPVSKENLALPWVTYPFIDFIGERLNKKIDLFEFGAGNSTFWYAQRVNTVCSVENNLQWFNQIKNQLPNNATIYYQELIYGEDYGNFPKILDKKFNMIIVDGRDRVNCMKNSLNSLTDDGIIVLDDAERDSYKEGDLFLKNAGFKSISFWGLTPGAFINKCTRLYYKINNCLEL